MSPTTPAFDGASTPKPSSGRSWVAPQFAIGGERRYMLFYSVASYFHPITLLYLFTLVELPAVSVPFFVANPSDVPDLIY